jgi:hypothetical protein
LYANTPNAPIFLALFIPKCIQMIFFTYLFCCIVCFLPLLFTYVANYVRFEFYKVNRKFFNYIKSPHSVLSSARLVTTLHEYIQAKDKLIRINLFWKNILGAYFLFAIAMTCLMQYFYINTRVLILQVMFAIITPFHFFVAVVWPNIKSTQVSRAVSQHLL